MLKLLISVSLFFTLSNATIYSTGIHFKQNPIEKITDPNYCYQRSLIHHELLSYTPYSHGSDTYGYHCEAFHVSPSSGIINADICHGPVYKWYERPDAAYSVDLEQKAYLFNYVKCSSIDLTKDLDGVEVVYIDGIPYDKSDVENASHFDPYSNLLKCKPTYLQINNMSCIKPDYEERNLADAILKRDKIAKDKNLTNVSGIDANNITYNNNGSIQSFSFTATNSEGGIESIYTEFKETDPVFTVEDDGTIKESSYIPPVVNPGSETGGENGTGGIGGNTGGTGTNPGTGTGGETGTNPGTGTGGNTGGTGTGGNTGGTGTGDGSSDINYDQITTNYLYDIDNSLNSIKLAINPDLTNPTLDNPLEESDTYYDDYVIPQISELVTNLTNDFNNLKNTYVEKIDYIKENGFEFDYESKLYETCPMNFKLNPFKDSENKDLKEEELALNIDICSLMANAKLPDSETSMLEIFYTIFYTFFYTVILLGIFKFSTLIFRSF
ncbi:hypothetical protein [Aliarcobacter cryaerophilus]|uniref:hypothetical protein n=1 Tax=Aliarcobacter cryaerophilus TaxID=28198 RepID=UPI003DA4EED5